jgi:hypothetical protein
MAGLASCAGGSPASDGEQERHWQLNCGSRDEGTDVGFQKAVDYAFLVSG